MGLTRKNRVLEKSFFINEDIVTVFVPHFLYVADDGKKTWARIQTNDECKHKLDFMHASTRKSAKSKAKLFLETHDNFDDRKLE